MGPFQPLFNMLAIIVVSTSTFLFLQSKNIFVTKNLKFQTKIVAVDKSAVDLHKFVHLQIPQTSGALAEYEGRFVGRAQCGVSDSPWDPGAIPQGGNLKDVLTKKVMNKIVGFTARTILFVQKVYKILDQNFRM